MCLSQVGLCIDLLLDSKYNVYNMLTVGFSITVCSGHAWHAWNIASGHNNGQLMHLYRLIVNRCVFRYDSPCCLINIRLIVRFAIDDTVSYVRSVNLTTYTTN